MSYNRMFELHQSGKTRGDCTAPYSVTLKKQYTVAEFVADVVSNDDEWGYIGIEDGDPFFGNPCCEYRWGKLLSFLPSAIQSQKIKSVKADGGWSRMDYLITLEDEQI